VLRERFCDGTRNPAAEPIPYRLALSACLNDTSTSQDCQMLRHKRLRQIKVGGQPADTLISLNQPADDHEQALLTQALGVLEGLQDLATGRLLTELEVDRQFAAIAAPRSAPSFAQDLSGPCLTRHAMR